MTLAYDRRADVLYISFETLPPNAYIVVENRAGDVLKLNKKNNSVIVCTIPYFQQRLKKGKLVVPEISGIPFNELAKELAQP